VRHELVEREDVGEGSLDDDVATSVTLHFTKQDPVAMWLRSTASCKNGLLCSAEQKNNNGRDRTSARAHLAVSTAPVFALRAAKLPP